MATFPAQDLNGTAYQLQLWGPDGGCPVIVSLPGDPDITSPEVEAVIHAFAADLATTIGGSVTLVARYRTSRTEITP